MKSRFARRPASESPRRDELWSASYLLASLSWVVVVFGGNLLGVGAHEGAAVGYSVALLLLGAVAFCMLGGLPKERRIQTLFGAGYLACSLALFPVTRSSTDSLHSRLETLGEVLGKGGGFHDHDEVRAFHHAAAIYEALVAEETVTPDLSELGARISADLAEGNDIAPSVAGSALAMGLLSEADVRRLSEIRAPAINALKADIARQVADEETTGIGPRTYTHDDIRLLVAAGGLSDGGRAALAEIVMKEWPEVGDYWAIHYATGCARSLELLGHDHLLQSKREAARALLTEYWMKPKRIGWCGEAGGFKTAVDGKSPIEGTTWEAIELMARFGIPDGVDPFLLRGYLYHEAASPPVLAAFLPDDHRNSYGLAALHRLEHQIGLPERSWLARLLAQRLVLITAIVVLMCAWRVWKAPRTVAIPPAANADPTQ